MINLALTSLCVFLFIAVFVAYWDGKNKGQRDEFKKNLAVTEVQRDEIHSLRMELEALRRERDGYADEIARFWSAANQQHGDYIE